MQQFSKASGAFRVKQFLRLCLCGRWDAGALAEASRMIGAGEVDWEQVCRSADDERVTPLLYHALRHQTFVPRSVLEWLRQVYERTARHNLYLLGELKRVLRRLSQGGAEVILLKGAALAQVVYGNPALRPMRDLDVLVHREAIEFVQQSLRELGYSTPVEAQPGATLEFKSEMSFVRRAPLFSAIEVHWSLIESTFYHDEFATDLFWQSARRFQMGDVAACILAPEAQTLHLCAHLLLHHGGDELLWLNDIATVIRFYGAQLEWDELLRLARLCRMVVPAQKILPLVASEWGAPIPERVLAQLRTLQVSSAEAQVAQVFTLPDRVVARRFWADLASLTSWRKRLSYAQSFLFPSRDFIRERYRVSNPLLVPLYYPYRWWLGVLRTLGRR